MTTLHVIRHGDLLLVPLEQSAIEAFPAEKTLQANNILAEGEVTGHHHSLTGDANVYGVNIEGHPEISKVVEVNEDQELTHQEHNTVAVPKGKYVLVQERELSLDQEARQVMD